MNSADFLGATVAIEVDRPLGSKYPRHGFVYPLNYGFVPGVMAPDGHELDAYVLGVFEPVSQFAGRCIAVIRRTNDEDDKLILVPEGKDYSDEQIQSLTEFQERFFTSVVLRPKPVGQAAQPYTAGDANAAGNLLRAGSSASRP